jgi:hypothetical protein
VPLIPSRRCTGALTLAGGVAVASLALASLPAPAAFAAAATPHPVTARSSHPAAAAAASYLVSRLNGTHHDHYVSSFTSGGTTTKFVSYGETADAALSMDAAGVSQRAVRRITSYLEHHVSAYAGTKSSGFTPGAIGKLMLLAEAQHVKVNHFGGTNLVAELRSTEGLRDAKRGEYQQNLPGTPADEEFVSTTSQALAMLALAESPSRSSQPDAAAKHFLVAQQCRNGGFPSQLLSHPKTACKAGSDIDSTGYAVQALLATGNNAAAHRGVRFLTRIQGKHGGFGAQGGNANSTAIAAEALLAAHSKLSGAISWLESRQVGCSVHANRRGAVNFQTGYDPDSSLLATSQAGVALAHQSLAQVDRGGARNATPTISCPTK